MAQYHEAVGRGKRSTARVRLASGSGNFTVNEKEGGAYFTRMGEPTNASPTQKSYAVVLIPKSTAEEARKAQTTCKAFINFPKGPTLALEPSGQGLILSQAALNPAKLSLLPALLPHPIVPIQP